MSPLDISIQKLDLSRLIKESNVKTFTGVRGWPVNTRVMTVTKAAVGVEMYWKAIMPDKSALF